NSTIVTGASARPFVMAGSTGKGSVVCACAAPNQRPAMTTTTLSARPMPARPSRARPCSTLEPDFDLGLLVPVLAHILPIVLASPIVPGIRLDGVLPAIAAGVLLGLINAVVRPVLLILTLPITLVTLGLFLFVLNGVCLWLVAEVVRGFHVAGFWAAILGALC